MTQRQIPDIPYQHHRVPTDDGVVLAAQSVGCGPAVLLANGIGVVRPGLDLLADRLRGRHRVISWDYRGAGHSPAGPRRSDGKLDMRIERHASDALAVLDAVGEPSAAVIGWSMGVVVGLEMIRQAAERVAGYAALFGAPGKPFHGAFRRPLLDVMAGIFHFAYRVPQMGDLVFALATALPGVSFPLLAHTGFVDDRAHRAIFERNVVSIAATNKEAYFGTMLELMEHDARDLLASIRCPSLVVAGTKDWLTPPTAAREMARSIPGARLVVLEETSHFGVLEHGPELLELLEELLALCWAESP